MGNWLSHINPRNSHQDGSDALMLNSTGNSGYVDVGGME